MKITKRLLGLILAAVLALGFLPMIVANAAAGDADAQVTEDDAGYLLLNVLFGEEMC